MKTRTKLIASTVFAASLVCLMGAAQLRNRLAADLPERTWMVDGVARTALVYMPKEKKPTAVIFQFHGHGGNQRIAAMAKYHELWPEAVVVYPQGLPTKGMTDPEGTKNGWQQKAGDEGDRDLKFFDAMLESLKKEGVVDDKQIFCTGHSNGGRMTYLLWEQRPDVFRAMAPSSSPATAGASRYQPKPVLHVASPKDTIVPYNWQKRSIDTLLKVNECEDKPTKWGACERYKGKAGNDVVTYIHEGGHRFPPEARQEIIRFFKEFSVTEPAK